MQNIFVSSNGGIHRTYCNSIYGQPIKKIIQKGQQSKFMHEFVVPVVEHQTAIGTLVANHYRLEVSTQLGSISSNNPCIFSPLFVLKKEFDLKSVNKPRNLSDDLKNYKSKKLQVLKAPEYWFKKNLYL